MIKIDCCPSDEGYTLFLNALSYLRKKYGSDTVGDVVNLFMTEFRGYLFVDNDWTFERIVFAKDQDGITFLMRFS